MSPPSTKSPCVLMLGLRGFPGVQGGVETHAEHLCPELVKLGWHVEVAVRTPYQRPEVGPEWQGVCFRPLWSPRRNGLEPMLHSLLAVLYAGVRRPDLVHIQAIGPAFVTPLARLLGLRVVVTHHGPDYDRQKWGRFARWVLRCGERFGMRHAQGRIVISRTIEALVARHHRVAATVVPNGVRLPVAPATDAALSAFGLTRGRYVLLVSRLVPEKRHLDLIAAFAQAGLPGWQLVLVGAADHQSAHVHDVQRCAAATPGVVMTGFQTGIALAELYAHAGLFVLPSSHEGLPIAMLEALSFGLRVIASDIPANLEVGLPAQHYFSVGDQGALAERLRSAAANPALLHGAQAIAWVRERYDWARVAAQTDRLYRQVLAGRTAS